MRGRVASLITPPRSISSHLVSAKEAEGSSSRLQLPFNAIKFGDFSPGSWPRFTNFKKSRLAPPNPFDNETKPLPHPA
jgi:hypothetical protein